MSFIADLTSLHAQTPRIAIVNTNSENSEYTNFSTFNNRCYLCSGTHYCEDVFYSQYCARDSSCVDCFDVDQSELCRELIGAEKCYGCSFGAYLVGCVDCEYCYDITNCQHCFLCVCMQNAEYQILNQKVPKEEYEKKRQFYLKKYSTDELYQMLDDLRKKTPQRSVYQKNCENCVGADNRNSKDLYWCFNVKNGEDLVYAGTNINQVKDSVDIDNIAAAMCQELYNSIGSTGSYNLHCCNMTWFSTDCYHCDSVFNSHDCFGCIARNHASYEILNKKYPKEEYFKKIEEIKKELRAGGLWGEMLIPSTYKYEDTVAATYYPEE